MTANDIKYLIYHLDTEKNFINARIEDETIWLTQKALAQLFDVESNTITYHLKEIYESRELSKEATARKIRVVQTEGDRQITRDLLHYSLDVIISVGYRVNSRKATNFRIWATNVLKEYMIKGFLLDDERLKQERKRNQTTGTNSDRVF